MGELSAALSVGSGGVLLEVAVSLAAPESVVGDSVEVVEGSDDTVAGVVASVKLSMRFLRHFHRTVLNLVLMTTSDSTTL